jgi:hypothetical protein
LKDTTDKQCSAVEVFTLSIRAFVDRLMMLERQGTGFVFLQHGLIVPNTS